jgi:hypothetical protein
VSHDPFSTAAPRETAKSKTEEDVRRDGYGRYLLPDPFGRDARQELPWTRVTTFAKSISDTYTLSQWSQRMVAKGLGLRPDLFALAAATPVEDKKTLDRVCEDAKEAAHARARAHLGTALHAFTEAVDRGETPEVPEPWDADVRAYSALVAECGFQFPWIERIVCNPELGVAGTFDRIGRLTRDVTIVVGDRTVVLKAGTYVIVDLKTGRDLSYGWNEIAVQLYVYATSAGIWDPEAWAYEDMPDGLRMDVALVIHLPVGEAKATLWAVDLEPARKAAQLCKDVREWRKTRNLASQVSVAQANGQAQVEAVKPATDAPVKAGDRKRAAKLAPAEDRIGEHPAEKPTGRKRRACSKCRQPGHTAKTCPGPDIASTSVRQTPEPTWCVCTSRSGWTAPPSGSPEGTPWVCSECGKPSRAGQLKGDGVPISVDRGPAPEKDRTDNRPATCPPHDFTGDRCVVCGETVQDRVAKLKATVRPPTWEERIDRATSKTELSAIRKEALDAGAWTKELTVRGLERMAKFTEPAG